MMVYIIIIYMFIHVVGITECVTEIDYYNSLA